MELKTCKNCNKRISVKDIECPYCKYIDNVIDEKSNFNQENQQQNNQEQITTSMKNYCFKCGSEINNEEKYCANCGINIINNTTIQNKIPETKKDDGKNYIIAWAVCLGTSFGCDIIPFILSDLFYKLNLSVTSFSSTSILLKIASLIIIITGKIKKPENKTIKVIFWLEIILMIISVIFYIIVIIFVIQVFLACVDVMQDCPG